VVKEVADDGRRADLLARRSLGLELCRDAVRVEEGGEAARRAAGDDELGGLVHALAEGEVL